MKKFHVNYISYWGSRFTCHLNTFAFESKFTQLLHYTGYQRYIISKLYKLIIQVVQVQNNLLFIVYNVN